MMCPSRELFRSNDRAFVNELGHEDAGRDVDAKGEPGAFTTRKKRRLNEVGVR